MQAWTSGHKYILIIITTIVTHFQLTILVGEKRGEIQECGHIQWKVTRFRFSKQHDIIYGSYITHGQARVDFPETKEGVRGYALE